jgi:cobalt-zinc-cadmium efflux system protein
MAPASASHGDHAGHDHRHGEHGHGHGDHGHGHDDHGHDDHGHDKGHDHGHDLRATPLSRLWAALAMTASFMFVEAIVGWWAHSLALVADAGHMLADAAALGLAIFAQRVAAGARTRARTYGFRRAEVLAAFANGIALALTAVWIFIEAVDRWRNPPHVIGAPVTIVAILGLVVNIVAAMLLGLGAHGHNVNTRSALAHVVTDALGSVGAIAAGALILAFGWYRADPLISAAIGVLVLWSGGRLVVETSRVLMEGSPIEIDLAHVEETLRSVPGVADFHDLHVWSISDGFDVLTVHVVLERGHHGTEVVAAVSKKLRAAHKLDHCTIQPEPPPGDQLVKLRRGSAEAVAVAVGS